MNFAKFLLLNKTNIYAENFALTTPKNIITCSSDFIDNHKESHQKKLKLFCDNAFS